MSIFRWTAPIFKMVSRRWTEEDFLIVADRLRPFVAASGVFADVGGGTGDLGAGVARHLQARVVVIDPSPQMLRRVSADPHVSVRLAGAEALPFPDDCLDAALVCDAFHHFRDQDAAIREIARVVKPGGGVLVLDAEPTGANRCCACLERILREPGGFMTASALEEFLYARQIKGTATRQRGSSYLYVGSVRQAESPHGHDPE